MAKKEDYAIKYKVVKLAEDKFLLFPLYLMNGESDAFVIDDGNEVLPIANYYKDLNENEFVADKLYSIDELSEIYDFEHDGTDFLPNYFFDDFKDTLIYVEVDVKNDILKKNEINIREFEERQYDLTYFMDKKKPLVALNIDALNELLGEENINKLKLLLTKYKKQMEEFRDSFNKKGVTRISLKNGEFKDFDLNKKVDELTKKKESVQEKDKSVPSDFTYNGLCNYIKERVFGHDEEIETIAKVLFKNATAQKGDTIYSVLITGPTGVGKTETIQAACEYLGLPYVEANAANLVPQGIKGTSIEDLLASLYILAGYNLEKAQRGIVFLDEYDKINESELEIKNSIKSILLTFNQGGKFAIDRDDFSIMFDTKMLTRAFAGVFELIRASQKSLGFGNEKSEQEIKNELELRKRIVEKGYFTREELDRVREIVAFSDLTKETRKRILLYSKLSELKNTINRYKRDYNIDIIPDEGYIDAILEQIGKDEQGMRVANNLVTYSLDNAEKEILKTGAKNKKLILTKDTAVDRKKFDLVN